MTMTETHVDKNELAEMTPAEFVGLIRTECMKPGRGMYDHPLVNGLENGSITTPQLQLFTEQFYLHISKMLPWIGAIYVRCPHEDVRTSLVKTSQKNAPDMKLKQMHTLNCFFNSPKPLDLTPMP